MKTIALFLFIFFFTTVAFSAEEIGAITIGINNYVAAGSTYEEILPRGLAIGLLVPVNFPKRPVHIKLNAAFHEVDAAKIKASDPDYFSFSNEVLLGATWIEMHKINILPQAGVGLVAERYRISKGNGRSHADFFIDLACRFDIELPDFNIGILINFERDFNIGYGSFLSPNRLNAALVFSK